MAQWFVGVKYEGVIDETDAIFAIRWKITGQCVFYAFNNCRFSATILAEDQCQRCGKSDVLQNKNCTGISLHITEFSVQFLTLHFVQTKLNGYQITHSIVSWKFSCSNTCSSSASTPKLRIPRIVSRSSIDILMSHQFSNFSEYFLCFFSIVCSIKVERLQRCSTEFYLYFTTIRNDDFDNASHECAL